VAYLQTNLEMLDEGLPALLRGEAQLDAKLAAETRTMVVDSRTGVERISGVLSALRVLLRDEAGGVRGDARRSAEAAARLIAVRLPAGVQFQREIAEVPKVQCSDGQLGQVLLHLLQRACGAVGPSGHMALRCWAPTPALVQLEVQHDGGLPSEEMQLGFSLAQQIIERAGGHLERVPEPGGGARYVVTLPAAH